MHGQHVLQQVLEEEARALVPTPPDLWPRLARELAARQHHARVRRGQFGAAAVLLAMALLVGMVAQPEAAVAAARAVASLAAEAGRVLTGAQVPADVNAPLALTPDPPFTVFQPTDLPPVLSRREVAYNPSTSDPETGVGLPALALQEPEEGFYASRGLRFDRARSHLLVTYHGREDQTLVLLQRPARPQDALPAGAEARVGQDRATVAETAGGTLLSAISEGTWLQAWSNLEPAAFRRALGSLRVTSRASAETIARIVEVPDDLPAPTNVTGRAPTFYRPTYLPAGLEGGGSGFGPPAGRRAGPPPAGSPSRLPPGPVSAQEMARIPLLEQLNWEWFARGWARWGGGDTAIAFDETQQGGPRFLWFEQIGPARLERDPGSTVPSPRGRTVWHTPAPQGFGIDARWWDDSTVRQQNRRVGGGPPGELWVWVDGETVVRIESNLTAEEVLRFIDGLVAVSA